MSGFNICVIATIKKFYKQKAPKGTLNKMSKCNVLLFLTFVLILGPTAWSAPHDEAPTPSPGEDQSSAKSENNVSLEEQNLSITPPPEKQPKKNRNDDYYYPFRQSISPRVGLALDMKNLADNGLHYLLGFNYLSPRKTQPQWEYGADLISNGQGFLSAGLRLTLFPHNAFRPFFKAGLSLQMNGSEKFNNFTQIKNYHLKVGVGLEDLLKHPMSFRMELEGLIGTESQYLLMVLGYSWGW